MKAIKDYPNYSIEEDGTVWSNAQLKPKKLKQQKASQSSKKYLQVRLYNELRNANGKKKGILFYVHRLVWETFNGEIPEGKEIDHIDNDTRNNHIDNLQLVTRRQNLIKFNREKYGYLTFDIVKEIRDYQKQGMSTSQIAREIGMSYTSAWRVVNNKRQVNRKGKWYYIDYDYDKNFGM